MPITNTKGPYLYPCSNTTLSRPRLQHLLPKTNSMTSCRFRVHHQSTSFFISSPRHHALPNVSAFNRGTALLPNDDALPTAGTFTECVEGNILSNGTPLPNSAHRSVSFLYQCLVLIGSSVLALWINQGTQWFSGAPLETPRTRCSLRQSPLMTRFPRSPGSTLVLRLNQEIVHDFILLFMPPCSPHLTPLATGSLERSLLVFSTPGGLTTLVLRLNQEIVHDFILLFMPPCSPHLTSLATGSLERSLLVFSTPGGLTSHDLFMLVLHLHQHQSSHNLHLQYLAKNQFTQHC
jgi:hypothetical protein